MDIKQYIHLKNIIPALRATDKTAVIEELVDKLCENGELTNREPTLEAVWKRERLMSTGLQFGIATPHAKCPDITNMKVVIGIKYPQGIDFDSLDKKDSHIFILLLSPLHFKGPHVQFLAEIARLLQNQTERDRLLDCHTREEIHAFFTGK